MERSSVREAIRFFDLKPRGRQDSHKSITHTVVDVLVVEDDRGRVRVVNAFREQFESGFPEFISGAPVHVHPAVCKRIDVHVRTRLAVRCVTEVPR